MHDQHTDTHRTDDHDTSIAAAEAIEGTRSALKALIASLLAKYGDQTDEELRDRVRSMGYRVAHSSPAKRRTDLYHEGLVVDSGVRRLNRNDRSMIVWHLLGEDEVIDDYPRDPAKGRGIVPPSILVAIAKRDEELDDAVDRHPAGKGLDHGSE